MGASTKAIFGCRHLPKPLFRAHTGENTVAMVHGVGSGWARNQRRNLYRRRSHQPRRNRRPPAPRAPMARSAESSGAIARPRRTYRPRLFRPLRTCANQALRAPVCASARRRLACCNSGAALLLPGPAGSSAADWSRALRRLHACQNAAVALAVATQGLGCKKLCARSAISGMAWPCPQITAGGKAHASRGHRSTQRRREILTRHAAGGTQHARHELGLVTPGAAPGRQSCACDPRRAGGA